MFPMDVLEVEMSRVLYVDRKAPSILSYRSSHVKGILAAQRAIIDGLEKGGFGVVPMRGFGQKIFDNYFAPGEGTARTVYQGLVTHFPSGVVGGVTSYEASENTLKQIREARDDLAIVVYTGETGREDALVRRTRFMEMIASAGADYVVSKSGDFAADAERVVRAMNEALKERGMAA